MLQARISHPFTQWLPHLLITGGLVQIGYYIVSIIYGLTDGSDIYKPEDGIIFYIAGISFTIPIVCYDLGMLEMGRKLREAAPRLVTASLVIAVISLLCIPIGLAVALTSDVRFGEFAGLGQISSLLAVTLLAIAVLRSRALSPMLGWMLLGVGLITFPVIILFAAEGMAWIAFALMLNKAE